MEVSGVHHEPGQLLNTYRKVKKSKKYAKRSGEKLEFDRDTFWLINKIESMIREALEPNNSTLFESQVAI